ncbi:hypothetical protein [Streptomyces sp. NPDC002785]|uniref:hypothetical protein n=1 Tax=Streptomyces sp. NPDC002785 TaxID=3154543 RepID=UPI0033348E8A
MDLQRSVGSAAGALASTTVYTMAGWGAVCILGTAISALALLVWAATRNGNPATETTGAPTASAG